MTNQSKQAVTNTHTHTHTLASDIIHQFSIGLQFMSLCCLQSKKIFQSY